MQTTNYTQFQKLSYKDIQSLLVNVSESNAKKILTDIKKQYCINSVLFSHFKLYFKV